MPPNLLKGFQFKLLADRYRTNIYCKGGVDTPDTGVDTMFQAPRQKMKKWSTSVDTRPGSTRDDIRSTLESLPRRPIFQMAKAGRHEMILGRH
ncbi:hypothetical protein Taro_055000 [Colocasia esculenta]|uniref:Uncharacterized protein n=1 Tax=Colocasia esculenta TaxID=4460 RepID=A0A843XS16_COLES|nr:hypothetical protein [Colocasia esculenta]